MKAKKSPGKSKAKASSAKIATDHQIEYVGNQIETNYAWLKLGLNKGELAAIKHIAARVWKKPVDQTSGKTLRLVVQTALMHWDKIEGFVFSDEKYWQAEGFLCREFFQRALLTRKYCPNKKPDRRGYRARKDSE